MQDLHYQFTVRYNKDELTESLVTKELVPSDSGIMRLFKGTYTWTHYSTKVPQTENEQPLDFKKLAKDMKFHPVIVRQLENEDAPAVAQFFEDQLCFSFFYPVLMNDENSYWFEYTKFVCILKSGMLLTVQHGNVEWFDLIFDRLRDPESRVRANSVDYLLYLILSQVLLAYGDILESTYDLVENIEEEVVYASKQLDLGRIHGLRSELIQLRKTLLPFKLLRRVVEEDEGKLIRKDSIKFFELLRNSAQDSVDTTEMLKDQTTNIISFHSALINSNMNRIMKVLTIIATIFIPLTFIAGIYGMNFQYMPELNIPWAYPAVLGIMGMVFAGMIVYFKKKNWF